MSLNLSVLLLFNCISVSLTLFHYFGEHFGLAQCINCIRQMKSPCQLQTQVTGGLQDLSLNYFPRLNTFVITGSLLTSIVEC